MVGCHTLVTLSSAMELNLYYEHNWEDDHLYKSKIIKEPKPFLVRLTTTQLK